MTERGWWSTILIAMAAAGLCGVPQRAAATLRFGDLQVSGNVQSQNLIRHPDASTFEYIQNRNITHLRLDYDWLAGGKLIGKYEIPFVEKSALTVVYRGVYDSVYDTTPGFIAKKDIHQFAYGPNRDLNLYEALTTQPISVTRDAPKQPLTRQLRGNQLELAGLGTDARDAFRFENNLRDAFVDIKMRGVPLTVRAGKQQIVWGETDNFRMLDRVNALDLTWHLQQEIPSPAFGWDEIRQPYWMFKFVYDLNQLGPLSQSFLEWYWNPGDWTPAKQAFQPRPWGLPFLDPLKNPFDGAFFFGQCTAAGGEKVRSGPRSGQRACNSLINGTRLFRRGDWSKDPFDNSQVGVRYHGITPQGLEFTLNYFYQRFAGDDGTNYAPLAPLYPVNKVNEKKRDDLYAHAIFPAEFIAPYVHTVGLSANYSDEEYTQTVFRFETIYDFGIPFYDVAKVSVVDVPALPGVTKKNMWKGMIGFDRPTWMRFLNKRGTIFLTGQLFWHYLVDNPPCQGQLVASLSSDRRNRYFQRRGSCLVGGLDSPSGVRSSSGSTSVAFRDKLRDWESIFTFAGFTFYRGGSVVPTAGFAVDPVNSWNFEAFWAVDWVVRDDFVVNLAQRYYVTPMGTHSTPVFETWGIAGLNQGRSETSLRLTYQF